MWLPEFSFLSDIGSSYLFFPSTCCAKPVSNLYKLLLPVSLIENLNTGKLGQYLMQFCHIRSEETSRRAFINCGMQILNGTLQRYFNVNKSKYWLSLLGNFVKRRLKKWSRKTVPFKKVMYISAISTFLKSVNASRSAARPWGLSGEYNI